MSIQTMERGVKTDTPVLTPILSAISFNRSQAYALAVQRFQSLGLTETEAKAILRS